MIVVSTILLGKRLWMLLLGLSMLLTVFSLPVSATSQPFAIFTGANTNGALGSSLAGIGDIDGDGFPDILVGEPIDINSVIEGGQVTAYSGKTGAVLFSLTGETAGDDFGATIDNIGDLDNDGFADFVVGAPGNIGAGTEGAETGRIYIYSGRTHTTLSTLNGLLPSACFGHSLSAAGDVNNDGTPDIIVGAPLSDAGGAEAGEAFVYSGLTLALLYSFTGEAAYDQFGVAVSGAGDVNNDGFADILIGASGNNSNGNNAGRAYLFSGATGELLNVLDGESVFDRFGNAVSDAGDLDNDGYADFMVGAPFNDNGAFNAGRVYVYSGKTVSLLYTLSGDKPYAQFGESLSPMGDANNDGTVDIAVGAPGNTATGMRTGEAFVFSGTDGQELYTYKGEAISDAFGFPVADVGDIDNDGRADILVGAKFNDAGGQGAGRAYIYQSGCCNVAGDANNDGSFSIADVTFGIATIFAGGQAPACQDEADANGDNTFNIADVSYGIARIFSGGPAPVCGGAGR